MCNKELKKTENRTSCKKSWGFVHMRNPLDVVDLKNYITKEYRHLFIVFSTMCKQFNNLGMGRKSISYTYLNQKLIDKHTWRNN